MKRQGFIVLLCVALLFGGCKRRIPSAESDTDRAPIEVEQIDTPGVDHTLEVHTAAPDPGNTGFEAVTAHVEFSAAEQLAVARPAEALQTAAEGYYITGVADPEQELLLDGEPVEARGEMGSFGVFAELEEGENTFTFTQGEERATVHITRGVPDTYPLTDKATRMRPEQDTAAWAGEEYSLSCVAPSGAVVTAHAGEETVRLEQAAATAVEGVPATFTGSLTPPEMGGTADLGPVLYTVEYDGESAAFPSEGHLFIASREHPLVVRSRAACTVAFIENTESSDIYTELPGGAVDIVEEISGRMYKLGMGGWVYQEAVIPLTDPTEYRSRVARAEYTPGEAYDLLALYGTAATPYRAKWGEDGVYAITLFHTTGFTAVETTGSRQLEGITVTETDGNTTLTFRYAEGAAPYGYLVEYDGTATKILLNRPPRPVPGGLPLEGLTIALDPGHGGSDTGAPSLVQAAGPLEKEINLATALAVQQYLRGLGASVMLTRADDSDTGRDARQQVLRSREIDFFVSLHSNSIELTRDGTAPSGTETYYYDSLSAPLAEAVNTAVCAETGRSDRGARQSYYWVTLSGYVPAVMVEMGFITNPAEYDRMTTKEDIYGTAKAIGDAIAELVQGTASPAGEQ